MDAIDRFIETTAVNWRTETRSAAPDGKVIARSGRLSSRYHGLPEAYRRFLSRIGSCVHRSEAAWFLTLESFAGTSNEAFAWNEWEKISLDAALDESDRQSVQRFWDRHCPVLLSVASGYAYVALVGSGDGAGRIVSGREPEFEEARPVCATFEEFLELCAAEQYSPRLPPGLWNG